MLRTAAPSPLCGSESRIFAANAHSNESARDAFPVFQRRKELRQKIKLRMFALLLIFAVSAWLPYAAELKAASRHTITIVGGSSQSWQGSDGSWMGRLQPGKA